MNTKRLVIYLTLITSLILSLACSITQFQKPIIDLRRETEMINPTVESLQPSRVPTRANEPTIALEPTARPTNTEVPLEEVNITIWHQWDGTYLEAITEVFEQYMSEHPNVTIDLSKPEDVSSAINVAIPAGEGPDIIGWANDRIGEQALSGNIVPLNDFGIDREYLDSHFEPAAVNGVIWQDTIWALPESQESIALIYNKDTLPARYIPTDPLDFESLYQLAKQYQQDTGNVLVCNQGFGASDAYHVAPIYFGFGVPSYIDDAGAAYIDSPEMIEAGEWLRRFAEVSFKENSYEICQAALLEGEAAMWWTGPWAIAGLEREGFNYGIVPMGRPFVGIKTLMLTTNSVQRGNYQTALDIMKYFTSAESQIYLSLANKTISANSEALRDPEVSALPTLEGFGEAAAMGIPMASTPYASAQWGPVGDASAAIWTGAQSPQTALENAQDVAEEAIDSIR